MPMSLLDTPIAVPAYNDRAVAGHVCAKLRKGQIKIGLGLVERYRHRIEEAITLYGELAIDPMYLAQVVVDDFKAEANATYGHLTQASVSNPYASTLGGTLVDPRGLQA